MQTTQEPRRRRAVVLAAGTLAVATLSSVAPSPAALVPAAASSSASTSATASATASATSTRAAGVVAATGVSRVVAATPSAPRRRPAPVVRPTAAKVAVAPYAFGTAAYAQWHAQRIMKSRYGWTSSAQFTCLVKLWTRESHWNYRSHNKSSGAHGIPQALPGSKMGKIAADWRTNPVTQIRWGLGYIKGRYGNPCGAWSHFTSHNWY